jgi:predicted nucleic acid-binding protein
LDKVLVDTSAWIEFFRKRAPWYRTILRLIDDDRVCCGGIILGELLQGAKSDRELTVLKNFLHVFEFLPDSPDLWEKAGELSYEMRRKGNPMGLSNCFIAVSAVAGGAAVLTLDRHFTVLGKEIGLKLAQSKG